MNSNIKSGDPKVRQYVQDAIASGEEHLKSAKAFNFANDDIEVALTEAAVALLKAWQTASTPYHQSHVLSFAQALLGVDIDTWKGRTIA